MRISFFLIVWLILMQITGCATGGNVGGDGNASATNNFNVGCVRLGKVSLGCEGQSEGQHSGQGAQQGTTNTSYGSSNGSSSSGLFYGNYACGADAYRMACPSQAVPGTNCRRC